MFFIKDLYSLLGNKKTNNEIINTTPSMINFYSQTLDFLSKYIRSVSKEKNNSLKSLQGYINIVSNISKDTAEYRILQNSRMNLLDDLRLIIILNLNNMDKRNRRYLKSCHSALHLITLLNKNKLSSYHLINEWLNSNCMLNDDEDYLHAMRGNFGNLIKKNPTLREPIEELCIIENHLRTQKISQEKYTIVKEEWIKLYSEKLPSKIKNILIGNANNLDEHWTEKLCYRLAYNNLNYSIEEILSEIENEIPEDDEIFLILKQDFKKLIEKSTGWIRLIYCFISNLNYRKEIYDSITEIATKLFEIDWQVSLDYFSFTSYSNFYFDKICSEIDMNPVIFDFLHRYSKRNNLDSSSLLDIYCKYLLDKKDYYNYCIFINSYKMTNFVIQNEFVKFLLLNYNRIEIFLTDEFKTTDLGKYITLYNILINKDKNPTKKDLDYLFNHSYTSTFLFNLLESLVNKEKIAEGLLIKSLDLLYDKQKDMLIDKIDITKYKVQLVDKLYISSIKKD